MKEPVSESHTRGVTVVEFGNRLDRTVPVPTTGARRSLSLRPVATFATLGPSATGLADNSPLEDDTGAESEAGEACHRQRPSEATIPELSGAHHSNGNGIEGRPLRAARARPPTSASRLGSGR